MSAPPDPLDYQTPQRSQVRETVQLVLAILFACFSAFIVLLGGLFSSMGGTRYFYWPALLPCIVLLILGFAAATGRGMSIALAITLISLSTGMLAFGLCTASLM